MIQRAGTILLTTLGLMALPVCAHGQSYGRWNSVLTEHTADDAALGTPSRGFFEYGTSDRYGYTVQAGIATLGGMVRATYSHSYRQAIGGLGYARILASKEAGKLGTVGAGIDFNGAMDFYERVGLASRAARLAIPLSLRWGSLSRFSIATYVAPYGEIGRETSYQFTSCEQEGLFCKAVPAALVNTHAFGIASGVQLTAWRLSLAVGLRDLPRTRFGQTDYKLGMALRLRF